MPYKDLTQKRNYQRLWLQKRRAEFFYGKKCVCGAIENLELHHVNPQKKVSHRIWSWSKKRRIQELKKCVVLCAKCHSILTKQSLRRKIVHGTHNGYSYYVCRCNLCTKAQRAYQRNWKIKRAHPV